MSGFLFQYHAVSPTTWAYLSSLLMIGLYFKFGRFWSMRNLDLLLLILLTPGLLLIHFGHANRNLQATADAGDGAAAASAESAAGGLLPAEGLAALPADGGSTPLGAADQTATPEDRFEYWGYTLLLLVGLLWLLRMLLDARLTRRPLLAPNLSVGGLAFIGVAMFIFLMANVIVQDPPAESASPSASYNGAHLRIEQVVKFQPPDRGPGYALLNALPARANKTMAVLSHLAIVVGLVLVAYRHFGNATNGIGAATLYLMLPYTSQMTGRIDHCLPAAFLVWAIFCYRLPLLSGVLVGAAFGCIYYPMFLIPLWLGFYWHRGAVRFVLGVAISLLVLTLLLKLSPGSGSFVEDLRRMFGWLRPEMQNLEGIWNARIGGWDSHFRLPVIVSCVILSLSLWMWPAQKNLATLISYSAAMMLASQFWHGFGGGLFIAWYMPLTLLMIFRPNLEDRVAQTMLGPVGWRRRSRTGLASSAADSRL